MNNEYISQLESARRLQVSYNGMVSLSEKFPDKLPRTVRIKEGKKNFFFKVSDVHAFKKLLDSQNQPKQTENKVEFLTQRDRLRNGFVFKDGKWL
jgi:hypothetical protein